MSDTSAIDRPQKGRSDAMQQPMGIWRFSALSSLDLLNYNDK